MSVSPVDDFTPAEALRVLLLEDSPDDAELLTRRLRLDGVSAIFRRVDRLTEFSLTLTTEAWDVILADYNLGGFTALDALAIMSAAGVDIPFIIVSGSVGEESAASAMRAGAHDFFLKDRVARLSAAIDRERRDAVVRRERREAVEARERLLGELELAVTARDEFLAIASHELKTPLTPLELQLASARDLANQPGRGGAAPDPALGRVAGKVVKALDQVHRLTRLVNSLLDVSRITAGHYVLHRSAVDLVEVVRGVVESQREALRRSGSELTISAAGAVRGRWDPSALDTAIGNLVSNAIKFGDGKPIEIAVAERDGRAHVAVTDRGIGIPADSLERVFLRFERAVPSEHYGGFGIGLWIARQLALAHGGSVHVASRPGSGSRFTIELPFGAP